ncbi:hypothetical protein LXL04_026457 [Taraxacum kok-saghyz]
MASNTMLKNWYSLFVFIRVVFVSDRHELKFVSCSCRVRVWPVSCSCLIPQTRIEIRVVFVFAKFVSCKFVSDTDTRHDDTNCQTDCRGLPLEITTLSTLPAVNCLCGVAAGILSIVPSGLKVKLLPSFFRYIWVLSYVAACIQSLFLSPPGFLQYLWKIPVASTRLLRFDCCNFDMIFGYKWILFSGFEMDQQWKFNQPIDRFRASIFYYKYKHIEISGINLRLDRGILIRIRVRKPMIPDCIIGI